MISKKIYGFRLWAFKVCSKTLETDFRNQHNLPNFKRICDFSFVCFQGWVEVYDKVFNGIKNQKIRAKIVKIGFATSRR